MTYAEFESLVGNNEVLSSDELKPGCYYYIKEQIKKKYTVYHGKFEGKKKGYNIFKDIVFVVNDLDYEAKPLGFYGGRYILDNSKPCDEDIINKNNTITQLNTEIDELKSLPVEEGENKISFIGKDYRDAKERGFKNTEGQNGGKKRKNTKRYKTKRRIRKRSTKKTNRK